MYTKDCPIKMCMLLLNAMHFGCMTTMFTWDRYQTDQPKKWTGLAFCLHRNSGTCAEWIQVQFWTGFELFQFLSRMVLIKNLDWLKMVLFKQKTVSPQKVSTILWTPTVRKN